MKSLLVAYKPHLGFCQDFFTFEAASQKEAVEVSMLLTSYQSFLAKNNHSQHPKSRVEFRNKSGGLNFMHQGLVNSLNSHAYYKFDHDDLKDKEPLKTKMRLLWLPQVPCAPFGYPLESEIQAVKYIDILANYDLYLYEKCDGMRTDYANTGFVQILEGNGDNFEWCDWYKETEDDYFDDIEDYIYSISETTE